jgi:hypothetical protein
LLLCIFVFCTDIAGAAKKTTGIARYDQAVVSGVRYLHSQAGKIPERESSLVAYALVKAGEPFEDELVQHGVRDALARAEAGHSGYDHIYQSGIDALLLAEVNPEAHLSALQKIADYVASKQHSSGGWSESSTNSDTSMAQYAMLALWAAKGAGATISPEVLERNLNWHLNSGNQDGSWGYRPEGANRTPTHNMAMAGAASMGIGRLLLFGPKSQPKKEIAAEKKLGVLEKVEDEPSEQELSAFPDYRPRISAGAIDARITRAFNWIETRFPPPQRENEVLFPYYMFYALERAAALYELGDVNGRNWYETYGDILLSMRSPEGVFDRDSKVHSTTTIGTSFAILYFMKSTQQTLDKQYGIGRQQGKRGNPFGDKEVKREPTELDLLIGDLEKMDFNSLDETPVEVADEIVRSVISIDDPEKLVGQADKLKSLMKHPNPDVRKAAVWALGRTGDFDLIPMMLDGIRDPSIDVNVEAIAALRYISRKPNGFGETFDPLKGLPENAPPEERVRVANEWRQKAINSWSSWYFRIRPHEEQDGFDQLTLAVPLNRKTSADGGKATPAVEPKK